MKKLTIAIAALLATFSLGFGLTACGGDSSSSSTETSAPSTSTDSSSTDSGGAAADTTEAEDGNQMGDNNQ